MQLLDRSANHTPSPPTVVLAALVAVAVLGGLTYVALVAPRGVPGLDYYVVEAQFEDVAQIADLSEVRIAGRHVGQVKGSELRDGIATVTLQLYPGEGPLLRDSKARIRLKGTLGAKFVEITPGRRGRPMASGATLPTEQTSTAVELLDVVQALDAPRRERLRTSVRGLGDGFLGRGEGINEMLGAAPDFLRDVGSVSESILARDGAAARFAPALESLARAYDPVRDELAEGFEPEARALDAFTDRRRELESLLDGAPGSLQALREGLDAATPLLDETAGLARATTRLTDSAPEALDQTTALLHQAGPALRDSRPLLDALGRAVEPTLGLLARMDQVIDPSVRALESNLPVLRELGRRGCDVLGFARNWRSSLSFGLQPGTGDPVGSLAEEQPGLGPITSLRVRVVRLTELESLSGDSPPGDDVTIARNPYPEPCEASLERLQ